MAEFSQRYRGGSSPMNINSSTQRLNSYNYRDAIFPIYDIAGSKKTDTPHNNANSYAGAMEYASIIQKTFAVRERIEDKHLNISAYIENPTTNGIDLKFTNQIPSNSDLEHPIRTYNTPKTYAQNDYFTIYDTMPSRIMY